MVVTYLNTYYKGSVYYQAVYCRLLWSVKLLDLFTHIIFYNSVKNICRGIRGKEQNNKKRDSEKFNINRLFEAVASGDVKNLEGLYQYLYQNMKKLSDSLCECERTPRCTTRCKLLSCVCVNSQHVWLHLQISPMEKPP